MNLDSGKEADELIRPREKQGSFYDADYICEQLIPQDSFYRKFREMGLDIVQEIESGMVSANYIRTLNIDEPLVRIKSDGTIRYYQTDALGSVIALTDETGTIKTQYVYDPYGNTELVGEPSDNSFQYTGRENDGGGHYYYRSRYYSPELQRFISEDPIGLLGGINYYAYTGNNTVNFIDPLGLYGTKDCSYYQQACKTNGGFYECHIAERACNAFPKNNETSNCIRQCLQEKHKARQPEGVCSEEGQTGWSDFFSEHKACFIGCFKNPENPYNPKGPNLPDKDIRLY